MVPDDIKKEYEPIYYGEDKALEKIVHAADKISALIKCIEERNMGNKEFAVAEVSTLNAIKNLHLPEVEIFLNEYLESYGLTLDEQK